MARLLEYLHQRRVAVKWLFFAALVIIPLCDLIVHHENIFIGDRIYCFWSMFGLTCCLAMIVVCKWAAHAFLEKDEDYYDK